MTFPDKVTIRDLLTHTSGLRNSPLVNRLAYTGQIEQSELDHVLAEGTTFNENNFGKYNYSNLGYNIYGLALHYHLHKKWQDLLQERIFTPAGLQHTTAYVSTARARSTRSRRRMSSTPTRSMQARWCEASSKRPMRACSLPVEYS
jgi:CubicO group peptidase (beta-lactamase class C family)